MDPQRAMFEARPPLTLEQLAEVEVERSRATRRRERRVAVLTITIVLAIVGTAFAVSAMVGLVGILIGGSFLANVLDPAAWRGRPVAPKDGGMPVMFPSSVNHSGSHGIHVEGSGHGAGGSGHCGH